VSTRVQAVSEADLPELLPLMRGYCDFYGVAPPDDDLVAMSRALLADPDHEGFQLVARVRPGIREARMPSGLIGFATVFWTWSTLSASRIGVMNDLFVSPEARGTGAAEALILACRDRCRERGATSLAWQTAKDNLRAQAVYERLGALREEWLDYSLAV
jgi:GNAT superfamily N-acetyltransferase